MDTEEFETKDKSSKISLHSWLPIAFLFIGIFVLTLGVGLNFLGKNDTGDVKIISGAESKSGEKITVHIDGAVVRPGVYELPFDSRIKDAIFVSGGLVQDADSAKINLAAKISDGQKILIPKVGEKIAGAINPINFGESTLVDINSASQGSLEALPGIGPITASKIINGRPYSEIGELLTKKIVGKSTFDKIKDSISVY